MEDVSHEGGLATETASVPPAPPLKPNSSDVGWNYGKLCDPNSNSKVKCDFCGHVTTGGIYRHKQHIANIGNTTVKCNKATVEAKELCKKSIEDAQKKKVTKRQREQDLRADVHVSSGVGDARSDAREEVCVGSSSSNPIVVGSLDKYIRHIDGEASKEEALSQLSMNEALFKERVHQVSQYVARWMYTHAIPFNACDNDEFKQMCEAIGKFGPGYEPPSQFDLREKLLSEEYARTKALLDEREVQKTKLGCTIMTDAWTDMKRRSIMNICTHCSGGTSFLKSKETSDVSHTSEVIFELVDKAIDEVGPEHVMQVVMDNASNNMEAKKLLLLKRPEIFWSSCATHTINLMLQGIGNIKRFKSIVDQAKKLTIFIYAHHKTLALMRKCTKKRDIIRPGVTRFASAFLTLQSLAEKRDALRAMVVDRAWEDMNLVKSKKGKDATATVMDANFWKGVNLSIKVFEPLVKVLRLVDGDVNPSLAWLYGELVKAKTEIKEAFSNLERNYKEPMAIIEKKMMSWWKLYGGVVPNLQQMAMRIHALSSSSSGCERNWSTFEQIHTKRRNRLTTNRLNNLVYIQFNQRMMSKKQMLKDRKKADTLVSNDASEAQGFLFEGGDDYALVLFRDEDEDQGVHPENTIGGEAMGAHEQLQPRRSTRVNVRDLEEEDFESEEEDMDEDMEDIEYEDDDLE